MAKKQKSATDEPIVLGPVVAERKYRVGRRTVTLQLGTPRPTSWKTDSACAYRIVDGRSAKLFRAFGVDAFQSLELALLHARSTLLHRYPRLTWAGAQAPGDVGLSAHLPAFLGLAFARRVEKQVAAAILIEARRQSRARAVR
jgi:hypothetical protein